MYKKILVPLDGSPLAEAALLHAEELAKLEHAEIIILRVPITPVSEYISRDPNVSSMIRAYTIEEAEDYVHAKVEKINEEHIKATGITREGPVPEMILEVANETHADMITMSTHGRSGIQRWLMGSVADKIVHHAHIPVMLIHPN